MNSQKETTTLILSRHVGETIEVGAVKLTVEDIRDRCASIKVESLAAVPFMLSGPAGSSIICGNVKIELDRVSPSKVRICIVAPRSVKITRGEHLTEAVTS